MTVKKKRRKLRNPFKKLDRKDPMVIILGCLLVFLTLGTGLNGCFGLFTGSATVVLDAAYGGDQLGHTGIVNESVINEKIVNELQALLEEDNRFTVYRTHKAGTSTSVDERVALIDRKKPDLVLSVQAFGTPDTTKSGMTVYADVPADKTNAKSVKAAEAIVSAFTSGDWKPEAKYLYYEPMGEDAKVYTRKKTDLSDTQKYELSTFVLMEKSSAPVVIAETFHVTNQADVDKWGNDEGCRKAAELYYKGLLKTFGFSE